MKRLVLIDGSSYLYRAFHALPPLTNDAGEPTGALFGVVNMLRATLNEKPDYVAFVVDAPGKTFRDDLDPQYKANRPPMPDELRAQVQPMCEIVQALGIDILRIDGVEADDVIGTLAVRAADAGIDVTVSTGDKDMAQLVRDSNGRAGIALVNTMSGSRIDSDAAVMDKFGVRADQIVDFLALMGDKVDNIPGVDKCGPKTAAKWLAEHGTLDGVMAAADGIKGKIGENLRAVLHRLPLNRAHPTSWCCASAMPTRCAGCMRATASNRRCATWTAVAQRRRRMLRRTAPACATRLPAMRAPRRRQRRMSTRGSRRRASTRPW